MKRFPARVGVVGCGNISDTYLENARLFPAFEIVSCADVNREAAQRQARAHGLADQTVDAMLADPLLDVILNLTSPAAHLDVTRRALLAGKHVYSEKPLGISLSEASQVVALAREHGLVIGCAPDTFLLGAHQLARNILDSGEIGEPVGGSAAVMDAGMESWHPNPAFFFAEGGGPVLDMGPYYVTALIDLLGPITKVTALGSIGFIDRRHGTGRHAGEAIEVSVDTTVNAVLRFRSGVNLSLAASWDVFAHKRSHIEIYGTKGSLCLPDPNWFGGDVLIAGRDGVWKTVVRPSVPIAKPNRQLSDGSQVADYRGAGLAEMILAFGAGRQPRANADLALHALDVMQGMYRAAKSDRVITITTSAERPAPVGEQEASRWFQA